MSALDWGIPTPAPTAATEADPAGDSTVRLAVETPPWGDIKAKPVATVQQLEINPARRRRATDLTVEPGDDVRAMARLLGQDVTDFLAIAIADRLAALRNKLHA